MLKRNKKSVQSHSMEVKVDVPITKSGIMLVILILLISLVGYAGFLSVNSIWKFTHPKFNISLDAFKSLSYISKGVSIPPIAGPSVSNGFNIPEDRTNKFLKSVTEYKNEFRNKHPNSNLISIPDTDFLNFAWSLCQLKESSIAKTGAFNQADAIFALKSKFILRYWNIGGLSEFLDGVSERALLNMCGDNQ